MRRSRLQTKTEYFTFEIRLCTEYSIYDDDYVMHVVDASPTKWKERMRSGSSSDPWTDKTNATRLMWGEQILLMHKNDTVV